MRGDDDAFIYREPRLCGLFDPDVDMEANQRVD